MSEVPRVDRDDPSGERRHWAVIPVPKAAVEHLVLVIIIALLLEILISTKSMRMSRGKSCSEQRRA